LAEERGVVFHIVVAVVAAISGGIASVAGFGIGSLLTPLFAAEFGIKTAVGAVAVPHLIATILRFWRLRSHVDWRIFRRTVSAILLAIGVLLLITSPR
jgi:uncharacterized membrane protein YfcA